MERREGKCLGSDEWVDLAGEESFPASDPPGWSPTHLGPPGTGARHGLLFRELVDELRDDVRLLSDTIGERNDRSEAALRNLGRAADAIEARFHDARVPVRRRRVADSIWNVEAVLRGAGPSQESVVIGAHYDAPRGSRGADDNASGVAMLIALAHSLQDCGLGRTVRLVAFASEEPPHLGSNRTGSARYLDDLRREGPRITSMMSLEGIGVHVPESQPWPFRLSRLLQSDLALVGDRASRAFLAHVKAILDTADEDVTTAIVTQPLLFAPVRTQSHYVFANGGIPAFMLTDTAPLRSLEYHRSADTADRLDYERMAITHDGLIRVVRDLARSQPAATSFGGA